MLKELLLHPTVCSRAQSSLVIWLAGPHQCQHLLPPIAVLGQEKPPSRGRGRGGAGGWWDTGVNSDRTEGRRERREGRSC